MGLTFGVVNDSFVNNLTCIRMLHTAFCGNLGDLKG